MYVAADSSEISTMGIASYSEIRSIIPVNKSVNVLLTLRIWTGGSYMDFDNRPWTGLNLTLVTTHVAVIELIRHHVWDEYILFATMFQN